GRDADPLRITNGGRGDGRQPKSSARLIGRNNDAGRDRQDRGIAAVQRDGQRGREIRVAHYRGSDRIGTRVVGHGIRAQDHGQRRRIVVHDRDRRGHGRKTGGGGSERLGDRRSRHEFIDGAQLKTQSALTGGYGHAVGHRQEFAGHRRKGDCERIGNVPAPSQGGGDRVGARRFRNVGGINRQIQRGDDRNRLRRNGNVVAQVQLVEAGQRVGLDDDPLV